jgi:hypothetical protein
MPLDFAAFDGPAAGAPVIEAVALADLDTGQHGRIGHRPPTHGEIRRHEIGQRPDGIILAMKHAHPGAEVGAWHQPEAIALDAKRGTDFVLPGLVGGHDSRRMRQLARAVPAVRTEQDERHANPGTDPHT